VPKWLLSLALVALATRAFGFSKQITFDCGELGPGATQTYVDSFAVKSKFASLILVNVDASNIGATEAPKCHATWTISGKAAGRTKLLFRHEENPEYALNGVEFMGTSPDGSKLLLDFFTAAGDYTGHKPAVYDFRTGTWQVREVGDRITRKLPACDYFTMVDRVTDEGDVILWVPRSIYVRQGCPNQGEWLLHMKTDEITRLANAHAPVQTRNPR
jgi:hypothetical protein